MAFSVSCEKSERIDDFPLIDPTLVVNGFFTADSMFTFSVSRSLSVLDNAELKLINDAKAILYEDGIAIDSLNGANAGNEFISQYSPIPGKSYHLTVSHPDYDTLMSWDEFLPQKGINLHASSIITDSSTWSIWLTPDTIRYGYAEFQCELNFDDPAGEPNYYVLRLLQIDTIDQHYDEGVYYNERLQSTDPAIDDESSIFASDYINSMLFFTDESFNGKNYTIKFSAFDWDFALHRQYVIELYSMSRSAYLYLRTREAFFNSRNDPFAEPVQVFNNVEGGYGIFAGYQMAVTPMPF